MSLDAHGMELVEGGEVVFAVVGTAGAGGFALGGAMLALLFLLGGFIGGRGFFRRRGRVGVEAGLEVADLQGFPVEVGVPVEGGVADGEVVAIGTVDGLEDGGAVFDGAADGAELVHGPAKGHGSGAGNEAEGGAETGDAATRRWGGDGAQGFGADGEGDASGRCCRCGSGGRAAGTLFGIPGIAGSSAIPFVAHGEGAEGELGDEDGAGCVEALDDGGIFVEGLVLESAGTPRGGIALDGEEIFRAPWQAVEGTAVVSVGDVGVGFAGLGEGASSVRVMPKRRMRL